MKNNILHKELETMVNETYNLNKHFDKRLKRYAQEVGQNWQELKDYFIINTDGDEDVYFNAVDLFLSGEGF